MALGLALSLAAGCAAPAGPEYGRALPPGAPALLPLGPGEPWPDVLADWNRRETLLPALQRSIDWTNRPSAAGHFPIEGVSHERALRSLQRFHELLSTSTSGEAFRAALEREYTVYKSAGWDGQGGGVLFTGYCTPILDGSRERSEVYRYPLYGLPPDLVKGTGGTILGQQTSAGLRPYPERSEIEREQLLAGQGLELAWLKDPLDAYIAHVNGSAVIRLPDRSLYRLGYAGKNGREYNSLGQALVRDGQLKAANVNLSTIRDWGRQNPDKLPDYLDQNASYVFFTPIDGNPRGSLNVEVTAERSLATDKTLFPRGAVVYVDTQREWRSGGNSQPMQQFMLDQDTGGAIRTAGRADIYFGVGPSAERAAGKTQAEGQLYYFFLKS
ncbi:MAG: murein transglycosylase A [Planctomycetota bacterium]